MNKKGAIELSINFIVVIIISSVIVVGGLILFFNLKNNLQDQVSALDSQIEDRLKNMMLSNGYKVAVYPGDVTISNGDSQLIGIGITNIHEVPDAEEFKIDVTEIDFYSSPSVPPISASRETNNFKPPYLSSMFQFNQFYSGETSVTVNPGGQESRGMLIKIPKGAPKGQYVYTIRVTYGNNKPYGLAKVYVNN